MENTVNKEKLIRKAQDITQKVHAYFAEVEKTEPLVAMDENNRICKYYPDGHIEVLKDLANA